MIRVENEEEFLQNEGKKLRVVLELTVGLMCGGREPQAFYAGGSHQSF